MNANAQTMSFCVATIQQFHPLVQNQQNMASPEINTISIESNDNEMNAAGKETNSEVPVRLSLTDRADRLVLNSSGKTVTGFGV